MGCYAKVEGRACNSTKYLFRCTKCKTVTCPPHMKAHAVKCGSFVPIGVGNPNSDRIAELEAKIELLEAKLAENAEHEEPEEESSNTESLVYFRESAAARQELMGILKNSSIGCFAKINLLDAAIGKYEDTFPLTGDVPDEITSFFELHNAADEDQPFKFMQNDDCRACRRKASYGG